ncbi:MAG: MFS transporter [Planctomycetota bacterium]
MNSRALANESDLATDAPTSCREKLPTAEKLGYGLGDMASNLYWKTFEFFLVYFYTDVYGLTSQATGRLMLVTRIADAVSDPLVGYLADRTRTAWGRFRPYLIWMCVPLAVTGMLTFYTPDLGPRGKLIYAYVTYTAVMMAYTAINVPYGALMGVMTSDTNQRTSISTYRFIGAFLGGLVVQYFTLDLVSFFGGSTTVETGGIAKEVVRDESYGFFAVMVIYGIAATALFLATFALTNERVEPPVPTERTVSADLHFLLTSLRLHQLILLSIAILIGLATNLSPSGLAFVIAGYVLASIMSLLCRRAAQQLLPRPDTVSSIENDFHDLTHNGPWMCLFVFGLLQLTALFIRGGAVLYYFKYYCGDSSITPMFWVVGSIAAIVGMVPTASLTKRYSKKALMIVSNLGVAACMAAFYTLRPDQYWEMLVLQAAAGLIGGPIPVLMWSMYADVADYSESKNHRRATGLIFAAATFSQKIGCAVGASMAAFLLTHYRYRPPIDGVELRQSRPTIEGLCWMMSLTPAAILLCAVVALFFFRVDHPASAHPKTVPVDNS